MEMDVSDALSLVTLEQAIVEAEARLCRQRATLAELDAAAAPIEACRSLIAALEATLERLRAARIDAIRAEASSRVTRSPDGSPGPIG